MDTLWAPWRMAYIDRPKEADGCVFCPMATVGDDRSRLILWRGRTTFCVMNLYPYNPGHLLCIPYQHAAKLDGLPSATQQELIWLMGRSVTLLEQQIGATGCNLGLNVGKAGGAGIPSHLHFHVVPRWDGDHNFMPVLAGTKSLPEYIDETYQRLLPGFAQLQLPEETR